MSEPSVDRTRSDDILMIDYINAKRNFITFLWAFII